MAPRREPGSEASYTQPESVHWYQKPSERLWRHTPSRTLRWRVCEKHCESPLPVMPEPDGGSGCELTHAP